MKLASDMNPSLTDAHETMARLAYQRDDVSEAAAICARLWTVTPAAIRF
ncbi:MAG: hypothetical protein HC902_09950 [Calothrix sp. SM1_5_4]|nr:hypothetical protein [Calothrix sp. SM1_5_4]